jgi:hypothetical protein
MNRVLKKFVSRAPRYVLRPEDKHLVRYSRDRGVGPTHVHQTKLVNLSETGLAILIDASGAPRVGERMKVELPVPNAEQIAWFALVVRVEIQESSWFSRNEFEDEKVLVALRFESLPPGHRAMIRSGLEDRFQDELRERRRKQALYFRAIFMEHFWKVLMYLVGTVIVVGILYALSRPTENYDPERGSPWGQRFQFFSFEKEK